MAIYIKRCICTNIIIHVRHASQWEGKAEEEVKTVWIRNGPTMTATIFEFVSRRPIVQFWKTPGCCVNCPLYTSGTQRNTNWSSDVAWSAVLMLHQAKILNYGGGCGYVWAILDRRQARLGACSEAPALRFRFQCLEMVARCWMPSRTRGPSSTCSSLSHDSVCPPPISLAPLSPLFVSKL